MADVEGINGMAQPETVRARKRYCRPLLRVGSTCMAINVTGLVYDPVQSTPARQQALLADGYSMATQRGSQRKEG